MGATTIQKFFPIIKILSSFWTGTLCTVYNTAPWHRVIPGITLHEVLPHPEMLKQLTPGIKPSEGSDLWRGFPLYLGEAKAKELVLRVFLPKWKEAMDVITIPLWAFGWVLFLISARSVICLVIFLRPQDIVVDRSYAGNIPLLVFPSQYWITSWFHCRRETLPAGNRDDD